jgi:hypothetical protein
VRIWVPKGANLGSERCESKTTDFGFPIVRKYLGVLEPVDGS